MRGCARCNEPLEGRDLACPRCGTAVTPTVSVPANVPASVQESYDVVHRYMRARVRFSVVLFALLGAGVGFLSGGLLLAAAGLAAGGVTGWCVGYLALLTA